MSPYSAALAIGSLALYGRNPTWFLVSGALIYFTWGEIHSLFPATCTDAYGTQYATTNAGMLYTAKGTAALLVPLANLASPTGDWHAVLWMGAAANIIAALMAMLVLRPLRKAHRAANLLKAGTVWINTYNQFDASAPFGGYKQSGFGREMGKAALDLYTHIKTVWVNIGA